MVISGVTVVEHLPHHPKVKGLSIAKAAGIRSDKIAKICWCLDGQQ